jgi:hypothetical protein
MVQSGDDEVGYSPTGFLDDDSSKNDEHETDSLWLAPVVAR